MKNCFKLIGGTLLITGTAMGLGMMAMPVATSPGGFLPAFVFYLICWIFTLCTGLLLLEACLWMPPGANFMTMTKKLLGPLGGHLFWSFYFVFFLMGMIAHILEGGQILNIMTQNWLSPWMGSILYSLLFLPLIYLGVRYVGRLNILLIFLATVTFIFFIHYSLPHVDLSFMKEIHWSKAWPALPILMFAFSFQIIIPTLTSFLARDIKKLRLVLIIGTTIPLIFYLIWEFIILGIDSAPILGELSAFNSQGMTSVHALVANPNFSYLIPVGVAFAFLTPSAAFATYALSFRDFLSDGMEIEKHTFKKAVLCFFMFLIPTILALLYPHFLMIALRYAGGINATVIFGLMPPLMVWIGRYQKKYTHVPPQVRGGRVILAILIAFALLNIVIQLVVPLPTF